MSSAPNTPETISTLNIVVAQLNPTVGAIEANLALVESAWRQAAHADLVVTPELASCGYPPEDLVLRAGFMERVEAGISALARSTVNGPGILLGTPWRDADGDGRVHNAVLLLSGGAIAGTTLKHCLPNYGVFDEKRVFAAGPLPAPLIYRGFKLGVLICEDMWFPEPASHLAAAGARILIVPNGSPFEGGKYERRVAQAQARAAETGLPVLYVNQVGGQDELVFDGQSFVASADGTTVLCGAAFATDLVETGWEFGKGPGIATSLPGRESPEELAGIYAALVLGLRDYIEKNHFPGVILGLSGGIDSALAAALAVDAIGPDKVRAVMLPSPYTSRDSIEDAARCAAMLGIRLDTIGIQPGMKAVDSMLEGAEGVAAENIQSRLRGLTLMAISNRDGPMVLSTGNKSEMAVGYSTLYGDMCGGFAVLKDVYKTDVYRLSRWRNVARPPGMLGPEGAVMPERVLTKAPTAELKPDQTDQDTLPPYDRLDAMLAALIEQDGQTDAFDPQEIARVWRMLDRAEYKRRQAPPGVKITRRSFGRERRYPITNAFGPEA